MVLRMARKVGVAVVGGTVVATGIVLIPLPGPGTLVIVGGLAILATEFPSAQRGIDRIKAQVRKVLPSGQRDEAPDEQG